MALVYNGTSPTGGDSLTEDLNVYYESGDIAWMITATALVLLMIPGVGYVHSLHLIFKLIDTQFLLLWPSPSKVRPLPHMAFRYGNSRNMLPMVFLGLLSHILPLRWALHW
jgi:hypothetical protein